MTKLISFEGIDGCGKTTLIKAIYNRLRENDFTANHLAELDSTPLGQDIAKIVRTRTLDATTEALLFQVARYEQLRLHLLGSDVEFILLDRYIDSTYVYQRKLGRAQYFAVNLSTVVGVNPHLTFILDVPDNDVENVVKRAHQDKFSNMELDKHLKINAEFKALAQKRHVHLQYDDPQLIDKVYDMITSL